MFGPGKRAALMSDGFVETVIRKEREREED